MCMLYTGMMLHIAGGLQITCVWVSTNEAFLGFTVSCCIFKGMCLTVFDILNYWEGLKKDIYWCVPLFLKSSWLTNQLAEGWKPTKTTCTQLSIIILFGGCPLITSSSLITLPLTAIFHHNCLGSIGSLVVTPLSAVGYLPWTWCSMGWMSQQWCKVEWCLQVEFEYIPR